MKSNQIINAAKKAGDYIGRNMVASEYDLPKTADLKTENAKWRSICDKQEEDLLGMKQYISELEKKLEFEESAQRGERMQYDLRVSRLEGIIDGLKFSIRCNGISGGEVNG